MGIMALSNDLKQQYPREKQLSHQNVSFSNLNSDRHSDSVRGHLIQVES